MVDNEYNTDICKSVKISIRTLKLEILKFVSDHRNTKKTKL